MISNYPRRPIRIDFPVLNPRITTPDFTRSLRNECCMYQADIWWLVSQSNFLSNGISFIGIAFTFSALRAHFPQRPRPPYTVK